MNHYKSKKSPIIIVVLFVALIASGAWYMHAQAVYHRQISDMNGQINDLHNHSGNSLPQTNIGKP
jgi:hypothetical protein